MDDKKTDQMGTEWVILCALKAILGVAEKGKLSHTYRRALAFAEELMPEHFAPERRILAGAPETVNARLYRQLAELESSSTNISINAYDYAKREYLKLKRQLTEHEGNFQDLALVKNRLEQIELAMRELKPRIYSEHKTIFGEVLQVDRNLPVSGEGRDYKQYALDEKRILRIRVLHPDTEEYKTGADVFYEHLDEERKLARLAIVQFKLWDGKSFHRDERMMKQIQRMEAFSCGNRLCTLGDDRRRTYRLPPCTAFLRPTDRLQDPNSQMYSSGLHVPLCVVKDAWEGNRNGGMSITRQSIENRSISNEVFEELFNTNILGGKELSYQELGDLYKSFDLFGYNDTVQIHAQEFSRKSNATAERQKPKRSSTPRKSPPKRSRG